MRHDQDVLAALQFHDDGFEADDYVPVRLPSQVAVVVLVLVAGGEVLGVALFDLGVGEAVANAAVELIERLPLELLEGEEAGGLDGAFERRCPDCELAAFPCRLLDQAWESA